jgi:cell division protease FtsH
MDKKILPWLAGLVCLLVIGCGCWLLRTSGVDPAIAVTSCYATPPPPSTAKPCALSYKDLFDWLKAPDHGGITKVVIASPGAEVSLSDGRNNIPVILDPNLEMIFLQTVKDSGIDWSPKVEPPPSGLSGIASFIVSPIGLSSILSLLPLVFVFIMFTKMQGGAAMGSGNTTGSGEKWKKLEFSKARFKFSDVAGLKEAKEELADYILYLNDPKAFSRLGAQAPAGALLKGPTGTGKTMLAEAVAGEAGVKFLMLAGSDFIEKFVGVGSARLREAFEEAKKHMPCVLFIDEVDAVGGHRSKGDQSGGGDKERDATVNSLLVELNKKPDQIIFISATNNPDALDGALLRSGRFDKQILVPNPDIDGRDDLVRIRLRQIPSPEMIALDVNSREIAKSFIGMNGADIKSVVNDAIILATREGATQVRKRHFQEARNNKLLGAARKSAVLTPEEKHIVCFHEGAHTIVGLYKEADGLDPLNMVTAIPRGRGLGVTLFLSDLDRYLMDLHLAKARMAMTLAGRVGEFLLWNNKHKVTNGASQDIEVATDLARQLVERYGCGGEKLGLVNYVKQHQVAPWSENTKCELEAQVKAYLNEAEATAKGLLTEHRQEWFAVSEALKTHDLLTREEVLEICFQANPNARQKLDHSSALLS